MKIFFNKICVKNYIFLKFGVNTNKQTNYIFQNFFTIFIIMYIRFHKLLKSTNYNNITTY